MTWVRACDIHTER